MARTQKFSFEQVNKRQIGQMCQICLGHITSNEGFRTSVLGGSNVNEIPGSGLAAGRKPGAQFISPFQQIPGAVRSNPQSIGRLAAAISMPGYGAVFAGNSAQIMAQFSPQ
jgi:hypothetical protein